jgi:hypothetical protein
MTFKIIFLEEEEIFKFILKSVQYSCSVFNLKINLCPDIFEKFSLVAFENEIKV